MTATKLTIAALAVLSAVTLIFSKGIALAVVAGTAAWIAVRWYRRGGPAQLRATLREKTRREELVRYAMTALGNAAFLAAELIDWPREERFRPTLTGKFRKDARLQARAERKFERALNIAWQDALCGYGLIDLGVLAVFGWRAAASVALVAWLVLTFNTVRLLFEQDDIDFGKAVAKHFGRWLAGTGGVAVMVLLVVGTGRIFHLPLVGAAHLPPLLSGLLGLILGLLFAVPACPYVVNWIFNTVGYDRIERDKGIFPVSAVRRAPLLVGPAIGHTPVLLLTHDPEQPIECE